MARRVRQSLSRGLGGVALVASTAWASQGWAQQADGSVSAPGQAASTEASISPQQSDTKAAQADPRSGQQAPSHLQGPQSATAPAGSQDVPGDIIVTAQKRAETVQSIPIAISAFNADTLLKSGVASVTSLQTSVSSLQIGTTGPYSYATLRGIGGELPFMGSEPSITVNQDGVPLASNLLFAGDLMDVERVEVLRGPQGTINGRNSTGGAINIYSNKPTDVASGGVRAGIGNYGAFLLDSYLSGPLVGDVLTARLAVQIDRADGWLRNTLLDQDVNSRDRAHARGTFAAEISPSLKATLILDYLRDRSIFQNSVLFGRGRPDRPSVQEVTGVPFVDLDRLEYQGDQRNFNDRKQFGSTLRLAVDLGPETSLVSTTAYVRLKTRNDYDCDGTRLSLCAIRHIDNDYWQLSQELTLTTNITDRLDLIVGGLYLRSHNAEAGPQHSFISQEYQKIFPGNYNIFAQQELTSYAGYVQGSFAITDALRFTAGVRYTHDTKDYEERDLLFGARRVIDQKDSWPAFTPRFAVDYQPSKQLTLYVSATRGFKAGGFNTFQFPQVPYDPEFVWSYEAGIKSKLFDNRLTASVAGYYMDYVNLQQNVFGVGGTGEASFTPQVINAGRARIKGIELELDGRVTDQLRLGFTGTLMNPEITQLLTADSLYPELGTRDPITGRNVRNLAGNQLPRAPKWQYSANAEYRAPISDRLNGFVRATYAVRGRVYWDIFNHPGIEQKPYGLINLTEGIETSDGRWSINAYVRNLLDRRYFQAFSASAPGLATVPIARGIIGEPRMYGMQVGFRF